MTATHNGPRKFLDIPVDCRTCAVRREALCAPLSDGDVAIVERFKSGNRVFPAGSDLYFQGETSGELYTLLDGWAHLFRILEDGRRQILDFALPGTFLGLQTDLGAPMTHSAQCLTDATVCVFPRDALLDLFRAHPELALRMAWISARDWTLANEHLTNVGRRSARERKSLDLNGSRPTLLNMQGRHCLGGSHRIGIAGRLKYKN